MKRQSVFVMILLGLSGVLVGSKIGTIGDPPPVPDFVPERRVTVKPAMETARPLELEPMATTPSPLELKPIAASASSIFDSPKTSYGAGNGSYGWVASTPSPTVTTPSILPYEPPNIDVRPMASYPSSYPAPVAYNPPSGYSYSQPHQPAVVVPQVMWGSYSQAAPYYPTSASSNHSQSAPARFQMALERTKNNKNIVVVLCDTATGECWNCQVGASKWNKMGAPSQEAEPEMNYGLDWPLPSLPSIKEE